MVDCEGISLGSSCAKLPHSRSAEISKTPPPGAGPKGGGKMLAIRVHMLDDNVTLFQVQAKALGRVLFDQVCKQLHLLEADYFGLEYKDSAGSRYWLDLEKPLARQVGLSMVEPLLHFCVKFYTPDPAQLEEEFTRYLFCLQIKRDLAQGHMQCNDNTAALMASYIVQAECGDYSVEDYPDHSYLSSYKFVQHQNADLEKKIMENHKKHVGQSPAEADLNLLETARRCELYGMKMHPVKDHEGVPLNLAVAHMGIVVFQNYMKIYTFSWAKVRKISFKRKRFLIKLHPDGYGYYKDVVEFFFDSRNECKNLWKKCVENHGFFRCSSIKRMPRQRTRVLSRGSSFRYSGKTQKQMVEFVRENYVKRQNFQRSQSFRQSSSVHSSVATNVGGSISAHPLIPLGDCSIVSASCGSMVLAGVEEASQSRTFLGKTMTTGVATTTTKTNPTTPVQERTSHEVDSRIICTTTTITTTNTSSSPINNRLTTGSDTINNTSHPPTTSVTGHPSYNTTSSQTDLLVDADHEPEECYYSWQRSASAKELRKQESAGSNQLEPSPRRPSNRSFAIAGTKSPSFERDPPPEPKVYSSSYPGGTTSTSSLLSASGDSTGGGDDGGLGGGAGGSVLVIDTGSSHDDLSHDSYELLARSVSDEDEDDEELFTMDDVEQSPGPYVEPRYRDMGFNEFNERCKEGIARFRRQLEFTEFENTKTRAGQVIGYAPQNESEMFPYYYPVERAKSEPFVSSDFWRVARQHRKLFHQKSFDYTPSESLDSADSNASKSAADIPYTLHKRQKMNGTALQPKVSTQEKTLFNFECQSPASPQRTIPSSDVQNRRATSDFLDSQDSGLSMSAGGPDSSVDELDIQLKPIVQKILKPSLAKVSSEEGTISGRPPRSSILSRSGKALSADSGILRKASSLERAGVEIIKIPSQDGEGIVICSTDDSKDVSVDTTDPDVIIVEYHTKRKRAFQKRSSSGGALVDKRANSNAGKQWRSESSSSFEFPVHGTAGSSEFRRERFSKELKTSIEGKVVRETREEREIKKQKSEELERKMAESDLRKQKSEELPKRQLSIGPSEDREQRRREAIEKLKKEHDELNKIEVARDEDEEDKRRELLDEKKKKPKLAPKPVVQKQEKVVSIEINPAEDGSSPSEKVTMEVPVEINASERQLSYCMCSHSPDKPRMDSITEEEKPVEPEPPPPPPPLPPVSPISIPSIPTKLTSPELVWKKLGDLPAITKRERSPVLFARLGFSDGSVFPATHQQSPGSSRRAKSLDAPVVSLHRLPPVTSFSSKDDTVDDESGAEMEEKPLLPAAVLVARPPSAFVIEEEDTSNLVIQDSNEFVAVLTPEPDLLAQALQVQSPPEVLQLSSSLGSPIFLQTYKISSPPSTHLHVDEQELTEVVPFTPPPPQKFNDEQKVPDSFRFSHHDEDEEYGIHRVQEDDEDDDSYNNDVFVDQGNESDAVFEQEPQPERRPSTRQERLDSFKNTKSYSVDIWTSEETEANPAKEIEVKEVERKEEIEVEEEEKTVLDDRNIISPPQLDEIPALPSDLASLCERFPPDPSTLHAFPAKRSFDDDVSSCSSSAMLKPRSSVKPFSLESSGSSSLEEGIFPPDDSSHFADEEEGSSNSAKDEYQGFGYSMTGAEIVISGYSGGALGLSRTLSRISERSTTSEQERSDFDDDVSSTKPSSRSMSAEDESLVSSDRQPSLSSDPTSSSVNNYPGRGGIGGDNDEAPLPPLPPEPTDGPPPPPLAFALPPPLLLHPCSTGGDDDWPSPPNSSFDTPIISGHVQTFFMEQLRPDEATKVTLRYDGEQSSSDSEYENKTLQEDDVPEDSSMKENKLKVQGAKKYRHGNSSDTSLGSSTTTGTTVRHCSSSTVFVPSSACIAPLDDSSLAEFGSSLSTEMLSSSRKNSDDSSCFRRRSYATPQRSFDDYDSPYSESADEAPRLSAAARARTYANLPSPTGRKTPKGERRMTSGSSPSSAVKSIARSKCYSYYSLARSPPSDGSSSSLDTADPPATPNTIPRVSKRRHRHIPPSKRRHRATIAVSATETECRVISASSPSVVGGNSGGGEQAYPQSPPKVNNNNNIATSTPKMNGGPTHNGEIASPELSPLKTVNATDTLDGEVKKKRYSTDKAYFIAKELLMTERTFKKDIEVISIRLKDQFESKPLDDAPSIWRLIHLIEPIDSVHLAQLKTFENHVANWESRTLPQNRLADVLVGICQNLPIYSEYLNEVESVLADLSKDLTRELFETLYTTFEQFKGCYLPLTLFILKPLQRLLHYTRIVERLTDHYGPQHPDFLDCEKAKNKLSDVNQLAEKVLAEAENYVQLLELSRDLAGFEGTLTEGGRRFIRQGCLAKFSQKKGYQQRMFFLLSDMLLYSNLVGHNFKVHGQLPLKSLALEEREDNPSPHSFTIYSEKRAITVSASSQEEKDKWLEDLSQAIEQSKVGPNRNTSLISLKCSSSADDVSERDKNDEGRGTPQRSNTTVHVCWHRNTSVCLNDQIRAAQNQLSGYLLRKFKNSNGWQKLWVVFTNFCLFFYKTYQDSSPLASLPLLGYSVSPPAPGDEINKDFVFKLQFKNHVYFFRAESQYTFDRWMEVIGSATMHSGRARLFSRKESSLERSFNSN